MAPKDPPSTSDSFTSELFLWNGAESSWTFLKVPEEFAPPVTEGWGRTPVQATVDGQTWDTSVWRTKDGLTSLAVPKKIRRGKGDGDEVTVTILWPRP